MKRFEAWMNNYALAVSQAFGERVKFIGIQGSVARGEDTADSDIDVVLLLDTLDISDIRLYRRTVASLPEHQRLCGFIGGFDVIKGWDRADLLTFYFDTTPIYGSLDALRPYLTVETAKNAILTSACQIYHAVCHNYTHAQNESTLRNLQKSAFFTLRIEYYLRTGNFVRAKGSLLPLLGEGERALLDEGANFDTLSDLLLKWAGDTVIKYSEKV